MYFVREKLALKNSSIAFICQIFDIFLQFFIRKLFIMYIGIEILGVNSTVSSILAALSVAELGFEAAIIYSLYKPIAQNNKNEVEDIVIILKKIYTYVGVFILLAGLIILPFLPNILNGIDLNTSIYVAYYIQVMGVAVTYFLGYKRTLLFALKRDYIRNIYISTYKLIAAVIQVLIMIIAPSYIGYVLVIFAQNLFTNISIARYCDRNFDYNLKGKKFNKKYFQKIFSDVKNIFWSKIAGYIYASTDALVLAISVGVTSVGYLSNYTQIFIQLKSLLNNALNSNKPIIGDLLTHTTNREHTLKILHKYTFVRYVGASIFIIPAVTLIDSFITIWLSSQYILPLYITILIAMELFITIVHGALVDYIGGLGYFSQDKKIAIVGAVLNLILSIWLVNIYGVAGVLIGTLISQLFFWVTRSLIVFRNYYKVRTYFIEYWLRQFSYILVFITSLLLSMYMYRYLPFGNSYLKFSVGGLLSIILIILINTLVFHRYEEYKYTKSLLVKIINKVIKKDKNK